MSSSDSLSSYVRRLEAATSRLEDLAASSTEGAPTSVGGGPSAAAGLASSASTGTVAGGAAAPHAAAAAASSVGDSSIASAPAADSPALSAWDDYLDHQLKEYSGLSDKIGGLVAAQVSGSGAGSVQTGVADMLTESQLD